MNGPAANCRRSTLVHVNCDRCGQKPDVVHRPRNERGACYCEDCCPACAAKAAENPAPRGNLQGG
jgi:hypothetical protein